MGWQRQRCACGVANSLAAALAEQLSVAEAGFGACTRTRPRDMRGGPSSALTSLGPRSGAWRSSPPGQHAQAAPHLQLHGGRRGPRGAVSRPRASTPRVHGAHSVPAGAVPHGGADVEPGARSEFEPPGGAPGCEHSGGQLRGGAADADARQEARRQEHAAVSQVRAMGGHRETAQGASRACLALCSHAGAHQGRVRRRSGGKGKAVARRKLTSRFRVRALQRLWRHHRVARR